MPSSRDSFKRTLHRNAEGAHAIRWLRSQWEIVFASGRIMKPCQGNNGRCWRPAEPGQLCTRCQSVLNSNAAQQQQKDAEE